MLAFDYPQTIAEGIQTGRFNCRGLFGDTQLRNLLRWGHSFRDTKTKRLSQENSVEETQLRWRSWGHLVAET